LSELALKCVIGFDRVVQILETNENGTMGHIISNVQQNRIVMWRSEEFFQANGIGAFGGFNLFS
jgi:hypothetical protein